MRDGSVNDNLMANILEQTDRLARRYKKNKTTESLIEFVQFRSDCMDIIVKLTSMGLYSFDELQNCIWYINMVTDELEIEALHSENVLDAKVIERVKMWRSCRRNDD